MTSAWKAVWRDLCPRCRRGTVHRKGLAMHRACPVCGLKYEREQGYFLGAMYVSYMVSAPVITVIFIALWRLSGLPWDDLRLLLWSGALFLPFVLPITRLARVMWIYFDRHFDP